MSATSAETTAQLPPPAGHVFFQTAVGCAAPGPIQRDDPVQKKQGKVTVKYDRKELRKRLILEEWIIEQLSELYDCEVRPDQNRNRIAIRILYVMLYTAAGILRVAFSSISLHSERTHCCVDFSEIHTVLCSLAPSPELSLLCGMQLAFFLLMRTPERLETEAANELVYEEPTVVSPVELCPQINGGHTLLPQLFSAKR
ncbi:hypothetical protein DNTS_035555 [Danionella cerebrum]|uniref:Protein phosphatase 1 regulatory subunit 14C n=1 Tax=Danionella cerebrum TaxID=2873325 RepID=A0A553NRD3_9TELE|nr:hypothetical protein DNTS_035555 [Danionella translucida]